MTSPSQILAANIRRRQQETGLNAFQIGAAAGISPATIKRLAAGEAPDFQVSRLADLAAALSCTPAELLNPQPTEDRSAPKC